MAGSRGTDEIEKIRDVLAEKELQRLQASVSPKNDPEPVDPNTELTASVAKVLSDALKLAETQDHQALAKALAPAVIGTVRREIWNSKEQVVEALYPMAGQLVSAYVSDSLTKLVSRRDSGTLRSWWWVWALLLRLRSIFTGVPYQKLKLLYLLGIRLEQVLVVKRGAGILVDEWHNGGGHNSGDGTPGRQMIASMLAAINEFATEALASESGALRTLDLGASHIFLRATPAYIIAIKCAGARNHNVERHVNAALTAAIEKDVQLANMGAKETSVPPQQQIAERIASSLEKRLFDPDVSFQTMPRPRPILVYAFFLILGFLGAGYLGKVVVERGKAEVIKQRVTDIIAAYKDGVASEIHASVSGDGRIVSLSGVVPSQKTADDVTNRIRAIIGDVEVKQQFTLAISPPFPPRTVKPPEKPLGQVSVLKTQPVLTASTDQSIFPDRDGLEIEYRYGLVAISIAVASLGCFAGLLLTTGIDTRKRNDTIMRIISGGLSVGGSIWSMHFISILALRMPFMLTYDVTLTVLSAGIAIVVTGIALAVVGLRVFGASSLVLAGTIMGLGVGAMHYTGMAAIRGECSVSYTSMSVAIAFIISIEACLIALHVAFHRNRGILGTCLGSVALGFAIASMHYSAMEGTRFLPHALTVNLPSFGFSSTELALSVSLVAYTVCSLSLVLYSWLVFRTRFLRA